MITFALTTFLLALGYRSFVLVGHDEVQDDVEDRRIARIRQPVASLETDGDDDGDDDATTTATTTRTRTASANGSHEGVR